MHNTAAKYGLVGDFDRDNVAIVSRGNYSILDCVGMFGHEIVEFCTNLGGSVLN